MKDVRIELLRRKLRGELTPEEEKQLKELQKKFNEEVASVEAMWYNWLKGETPKE